MQAMGVMIETVDVEQGMLEEWQGCALGFCRIGKRIS